MLTNTPSHPRFLDAVERGSDVQAYGATVTPSLQRSSSKNNPTLINLSSHGASSITHCTDDAPPT